MKIAVIGTRGIPATFGGIERHCEELYSHIVKMGHDVTIYARKGYIDSNVRLFRGIKIVPLWAPQSKHLETIFHTFWALLHIIFSDADIIHFHAQGPCLFAWLPKLLSPAKKLVFTCHGLDWQRNKWSLIAKNIIQIGEIFSARFFDERIMVSNSLEEHYKKQYGVNSEVIANGTTVENPLPPDFIKNEFGLNNKDYLLFIGRLVPEKAPHKLIEAFKKIDTHKKLVITGGSSATGDYVNYLKRLASGDTRIIFTSYLYENALKEIYSNAYLYVSTSELEGMPLTLLEAMSYGIPTVVSPIPVHIEVVNKYEKFGYVFPSGKIYDIKTKLQSILDSSEDEKQQKGISGKQRIKECYNWQFAAEKLDKLYRKIGNLYIQ